MIARAAALLVGGVATLALMAPAFADPSVRLTLVREQILITEEFETGPWPLLIPCGNAGFLYVDGESVSDLRWYLNRYADGSLVDVGIVYPGVFPTSCSSDGKWLAIRPELESVDLDIVSLDGKNASLSVPHSWESWGHDIAAKAFFWSYEDRATSAQIEVQGNLDDFKIFAGRGVSDMIPTSPVWTSENTLIFGRLRGNRVELVEVPADPFLLDVNAKDTSLSDIPSILAGPQASLVFVADQIPFGSFYLQTIDSTVLIQQASLDSIGVRAFCTKNLEWQCATIATPSAINIAGVYDPWVDLLDSSGRLFSIEDRAGKFCVGVAANATKQADCVEDGSLKVFEKILWYSLTPDRLHLLVIGQKAGAETNVVSVFRLVISSGD